MTGAGVLICPRCGWTWTAPPVRSCPYCGKRDDDEVEGIDDDLEDEGDG